MGFPFQIASVLTKVLQHFISLLLVLMVTVVLALVTLRYIFGTGIVGANEAVTILFVYSTALGAAVAVGSGEHIAIRFLVEKFRTQGKSIATLISLGAIGALNTVIFVYSLGWIGRTGLYLMPATGLPRAVLQAAVPLSCALVVVYCGIGVARIWQKPHHNEDDRVKLYP